MSVEDEMLESLEAMRRPKVANPFAFEIQTPMGPLAVVIKGMTTARFRSKEPLRFEGETVRVEGLAVKDDAGTWHPTECETAMPNGKDFPRLVGRAKVASFELALSRNLTKALGERQDILIHREIVALRQAERDLEEAIEQVTQEIERRYDRLDKLGRDKERLTEENGRREKELRALLKNP